MSSGLRDSVNFKEILVLFSDSEARGVKRKLEEEEADGDV